MAQPALSAADFRDVRERVRSFTALAAFRPNFTGYTPPTGDPIQLIGALVTEEFFAVFGLPAQLGRTFRADEYGAAAPRTAVLSAAGRENPRSPARSERIHKSASRPSGGGGR